MGRRVPSDPMLTQCDLMGDMRGQALPAMTDEHALALEQRPVVVKLGGSVVRSAELPAWLDAIAASRHPIVIVPGGGALADEVRAAQARLGFGDGAAHRMPQIQFSSEQADAILDYLGGLVGKPPSQRAPAAMPSAEAMNSCR